MKITALLSLTLLFAACSKQEETTTAPPAVKPKSSTAETKRMMPEARRSVPAAENGGAASAVPEVPKVSPEQIKEWTAKSEVLLADWEAFQKLPDDQKTDEALKAMREKYQAVMKARGELMKGMSLEQRKEYARTIFVNVSKVGSGLMSQQLNRGRRNLPAGARRVVQPPQPAVAPADPSGTVPPPGEGTPNPEPAPAPEGAQDSGAPPAPQPQ